MTLTLTPDPANPNRMDDDDKARMARALAEFGDLSGIVINRRTGLLIGGHQRADVLRAGKLTVTDLPEPEADGTVARGHLEHVGRRYAVRVVDWPPEKAHAALLAANRFGRVGQDDHDALCSLLEELTAGQRDISTTGYDEEFVEDLMTSTPEAGAVIKALELFPYEHYDYVLVMADRVQDWEWLSEFCELERVDGRNPKSGAKIGLGRAIRASKLIDKIQEAINEARLAGGDTKPEKKP
jgi:hypothetical protein